MSKAPEEGLIWEWRAFGRISESLTARIHSHPIRMNILDREEEDIYFISPSNDQNVKQRNWRGLWLLKLKLLLKTGPDSTELYSESPRMMFAFPVPIQTLENTARLLGMKLPEPAQYSFEREEFTEALAHAQPPASIVEVSKIRSQFEFSDGWAELADAKFPHARMQTISIHSSRLEAVERILDELRPDSALEAMNYVEACRRWGKSPERE